MNTKRTAGTAAILLSASVGLGACGNSGDSAMSSAPSSAAGSMSSGASPSMAPSESSSMSSSPSMSSSSDGSMAAFGPACSQIPKTGAGSAAGMAKDPVATAAGNNPLLSTLVTAVGEADLAQTLNSAQDITVFAPANAAFEKLPKDTLSTTLADKKALTSLLTYHVVSGKLTPQDVAGSHKTLAGPALQVSGTGENMTVGKGKAKVLCGNVQTANATVYIIDGVLMP